VGEIGWALVPAASETLGCIAAVGALPVLELGSMAEARPLLDALVAAACRRQGFTLRTEAGLPAIGVRLDSHPEALVGASTVRSAEDARRVIGEGASSSSTGSAAGTRSRSV
jgi:2-keto-3-deoxy-6-phosphogluconate aldolase